MNYYIGTERFHDLKRKHGLDFGGSGFSGGLSIEEQKKETRKLVEILGKEQGLSADAIKEINDTVI